MRQVLIAALIANAFLLPAQAEPIVLKCDQIPPSSLGSSELRVDFDNEYIEFGHWPTQPTLIDWGDRYIFWAQNDELSAGIFAFDRLTSQIIIRVVTGRMFDMSQDERNRWHSRTDPVMVCVRTW